MPFFTSFTGKILSASGLSLGSDPILGESYLTSFEPTSPTLSKYTYDPSTDTYIIAHYNAAAVPRNLLITAVKINSDKSLNVGTTYTVTNTHVDSVDLCFDSSVNKVICVFIDEDTIVEGVKGFSITSNSANTNLSFGTQVQISTKGNLADVNIGFDPVNNKCICIYEDDDNSDPILGQVITANTNGTISAGTVTTVNSSISGINIRRMDYDSTANKFVAILQDGLNIYAQAYGISGTSITAGSATLLYTYNTTVGYDLLGNLAYHPIQNRHYALIERQNNNSVQWLTMQMSFQVSGLSITSVSSITTIATDGACSYPYMMYDSNLNRMVVCRRRYYRQGVSTDLLDDPPIIEHYECIGSTMTSDFSIVTTGWTGTVTTRPDVMYANTTTSAVSNRGDHLVYYEDSVAEAGGVYAGTPRLQVWFPGS